MRGTDQKSKSKANAEGGNRFPRETVPAGPLRLGDACASSWRCFLEDVDRYRLRPRSRAAVVLLSQGLWASAVYRFFYPLVRARTGWLRILSHVASVFAVKAVDHALGVILGAWIPKG